MRIQEALQILRAKLVDIEEDRNAELAASEAAREAIDAKAEARAISAVFDFLQDCKVKPSESLLRLFRRYLQPSQSRGPVSQQRHLPRSRAS
ncbi:MAG TPA: hypothetical protein VHK26_07950 [Methyloceanibacter sp.]|jgi:hypothetical protein|nr:hypothetical protein [Methyloceanibacter sp.]